MPAFVLKRDHIFVKLSKRLYSIEQMIHSEYTHIWDCCCDHGFLGSALLERGAADVVHFVDIVPNLMSDLCNRLSVTFSDLSDRWKTHCLDVAQLPLADYQGKHLVIIAGVGGDLTTELVEQLVHRFPDQRIDFLLCPVRNLFLLREKLIELDFNLKQEALIEENQKYYEVLYVSQPSDIDETLRKVSPTGDDIWHSSCDEQLRIAHTYLRKTIDHYRRIQKGQSKDVDHILAAYESI